VTEPINDTQTIAASESILSDLDPSLTSYARKADLQKVLRDSQEIMNYLYFPERYAIGNGEKPYSLGRSLLLRQMKVSSVRLSELLKKDPYLAPKEVK
jgi:hypothetical protein